MRRINSLNRAYIETICCTNDGVGMRRPIHKAHIVEEGLEANNVGCGAELTTTSNESERPYLWSKKSICNDVQVLELLSEEHESKLPITNRTNGRKCCHELIVSRLAHFRLRKLLAGKETMENDGAGIKFKQR